MDTTNDELALDTLMSITQAISRETAQNIIRAHDDLDSLLELHQAITRPTPVRFYCSEGSAELPREVYPMIAKHLELTAIPEARRTLLGYTDIAVEEVSEA